MEILREIFSGENNKLSYNRIISFIILMAIFVILGANELTQEIINLVKELIILFGVLIAGSTGSKFSKTKS